MGIQSGLALISLHVKLYVHVSREKDQRVSFRGWQFTAACKGTPQKLFLRAAAHLLDCSLLIQFPHTLFKSFLFVACVGTCGTPATAKQSLAPLLLLPR